MGQHQSVQEQQIGKKETKSQNFTQDEKEKITSSKRFDTKKLDTFLKFANFVEESNSIDIEILVLGLESHSIESTADIGFQMMAGKFMNLKKLQIGFKIKDFGAKVIAEAISKGQIQNLKSLNLSQNLISDSGVQSISFAISNGNLKLLELLNLSYNEIKMDGIQSLGQSFETQNLQELQYLDLQYNKIQDGTPALAKGIKIGQMNKLQTLILKNNSINDIGFIAIIDSIHNLPYFQLLYLGDNQITDEGLIQSIKLLNENSFLQLGCLHLESNQLNSSIKDLMNFFKSSKMSKFYGLNLNKNEIDCESAITIANLLKEGQLSKLEYLDLSHNKILDEGGMSLSYALKLINHSFLVKLNIENNLTTEEGKESIKNILNSLKRPSKIHLII